MPDPPLVSVITPAYDREDLIGETIESVLAQDYSRFEYHVIDDGSRDRTLEVMKRYSGKLSVHTRANIGETRTVNEGLSRARGDILVVVNSDDPLLPGALRRGVEALQANPDAVVAYPDWTMIDGAGKELQTIRTYDFTGYVDMVRKHQCLPGPGAFFRREAAQKVGGRDPDYRFLGDLDFWFRLGLLGRFVRIPEVLATFRTHPGSATVSARGAQMAGEHIRVVERLFSRGDLPPEARAIEREALSSACFVAGTCLGPRHLSGKVSYFSQALRLAPAKYLGEYAVRWPLMAASVLGISSLSAYYLLRRVEDRARLLRRQIG